MKKVIIKNQKLAEWIHLGIIYDGTGNITVYTGVYTGKDEKKLWRKLKKQSWQGQFREDVKRKLMKKIGKLVGVCNCKCHCDLKDCFTDHDKYCKHCIN